MINVKNLEKNFGPNNEIHVLKGINQTIKKGEKVVIIGPSGSGKSTFLRCLNLLEKPTKGQIFFNGEEITSPKCNINELRQKMGMVFQHFNLFPHKTVMQNMTLAPIKLLKKTKEEAYFLKHAVWSRRVRLGTSLVVQGLRMHLTKQGT